MKVLDLFSGIGGFALGLQRAGFTTKYFCEIDPYCRQVLAKHWPAVPCFEDVRTLRGADLGPIDLICWGFPCQDISVAGKGAGLSGARSGLWSEYARLIQEIKPKYVLIENVAVLRSRGLDQILREIAALGYDAEWHCIPASAVGAPHRRDRIWIVAYHQRERGQRIVSEAIQREPAFQSFENVRRVEDLRGRPSIPQPLIRGTRDGIPHWMDRLHAIGNAIVPQIAEALGRMIMRHEEQKSRGPSTTNI